MAVRWTFSPQSFVYKVQCGIAHTCAHTATCKGTGWDRAAMQNREYAGVSAWLAFLPVFTITFFCSYNIKFFLNDYVGFPPAHMILLPPSIIADETRNLSCAVPYNDIHTLSNANYYFQLTRNTKSKKLDFEHNEKSLHDNMFLPRSLTYLGEHCCFALWILKSQGLNERWEQKKQRANPRPPATSWSQRKQSLNSSPVIFPPIFWWLCWCPPHTHIM